MIDIQIIGAGCTRHVLLVGPWAIKVPRLNYGWRLFLVGLLANLQERSFSTLADDRLNPVLLSLPGGWLVVQRRVRIMTEAEFARFDWCGFVVAKGDRCQLPVESKADSFGWLGDRVVAVDYGS